MQLIPQESRSLVFFSTSFRSWVIGFQKPTRLNGPYTSHTTNQWMTSLLVIGRLNRPIIMLPGVVFMFQALWIWWVRSNSLGKEPAWQNFKSFSRHRHGWTLKKNVGGETFHCYGSVACSLFRCEQVKAKWAVLVTVLLGKEGGEARGGVATGFGAGKSSACPEMQPPGCGTMSREWADEADRIQIWSSCRACRQAGRKGRTVITLGERMPLQRYASDIDECRRLPHK